MKKYIGTKIVEAEPYLRVDEKGYRVIYADGYESWSPKEVFEKAYLPIENNPNLKSDRPSVSQSMVDGFIREMYVETVGEKTTVVRVVLKNGFEIVEASSCVSKENYDEKMGAQICLEKIKDKVWMLLGFLLQTGVGGVK